MKIVRYEESEKMSNGKDCNVWEYPLGDSDINCAVSEINGRFPDDGYCYNEICKEMFFVSSGSGILHFQNGECINFNEKDVLLIEPGEVYYLEGSCTLVIPCSPAWYPEQHKRVLK